MLQNFQIFFLNVTNIKLRYTTSVSVMPLCRNLKVFCIARAVEVRLRSCKARISLQIVLCMCYKSFGKIFLVLLAYYYISTRQFSGVSVAVTPPFGVFCIACVLHF